MLAPKDLWWLVAESVVSGANENLGYGRKWGRDLECLHLRVCELGGILISEQCICGCRKLSMEGSHEGKPQDQQRSPAQWLLPLTAPISLACTPAV